MENYEWIPAHPTNYSTERAHKIGVMVHWIVGTLESCVNGMRQANYGASVDWVVNENRSVQMIDEAYTSGHCGHGYYNGALISIELEGWPGHPPTWQTMENCAQLLAEISLRHGFGLYEYWKNAWKHQWVYPTACPGETNTDYIYARANEILLGVKPMNSTDVMQWQSDGADTRKWVLRKDEAMSKARGRDCYKIYNYKDGRLLDVSGGKIIDGQPIQTFPDNGGTAQRWFLDGPYIRSAADWDYVLGLEVSSTGEFWRDGTRLQLQKGTGKPNQQFGIVAAAEKGVSWILNLATGRALSVHG